MGSARLEHATKGLRVLCSTNWAKSPRWIFLHNFCNSRINGVRRLAIEKWKSTLKLRLGQCNVSFLSPKSRRRKLRARFLYFVKILVLCMRLHFRQIGLRVAKINSVQSFFVAVWPRGCLQIWGVHGRLSKVGINMVGLQSNVRVTKPIHRGMRIHNDKARALIEIEKNYFWLKTHP